MRDNNHSETTMEKHVGTNGDGNPIYLAITINPDGSYKHIERFTSEAECDNWIRWA